MHDAQTPIDTAPQAPVTPVLHYESNVHVLQTPPVEQYKEDTHSLANVHD